MKDTANITQLRAVAACQRIAAGHYVRSREVGAYHRAIALAERCERFVACLEGADDV